MKLNLAPVVITTATNSLPVPTDTRSNPVTIGVNIASVGANTFQVQYTMDDVFAPGFNPVTANWITPQVGQFTGVLNSAAAGTFFGTITGFCTAVRLNVTVIVTSVTMSVWQSESTQGA